MSTNRLQELDVTLKRRQLDELALLKRHLASIKLEVSLGTPINPVMVKDMENVIVQLEEKLRKLNR